MDDAAPARLELHATAAGIVLVAAIYLSSGTMAPYAATDSHPPLLEPCHYLVNVDHYHFEAVFRMIGGEGETWSGSVVLRRLLFPVIAYPFVMMAGVMAGGLIASILLNLVALFAFAAFVRRKVGPVGAIVTLWLLATYPGITYWAGLPYSYVAIVPGSLFGVLLLHRIDDRPLARDVVRTCFLLGLIFLAYDLFLFFGPAVVILLAARRRWRHVAPAVLAMAVPGLLVALMFVIIEVSVLNANTEVYRSIAAAYLDLERYDGQWAHHLLELPVIFVSNAVYGNLIFIPLLACAGSLVLRKSNEDIVALPEKSLLITALLIFILTNAAPPYDGWQMRGYWVARLYQPLIGVLLLIAARATAIAKAGTAGPWRVAVVATILLNASVAFGPVLMNPLAGFVYHKFYAHSPPESLFINMQRYGRRPLGFCNPSHEWDGIRSPKTPFNRPSFMYRYPPR